LHQEVRLDRADSSGLLKAHDNYHPATGQNARTTLAPNPN
jgi:hypothetical protein